MKKYVALAFILISIIFISSCKKKPAKIISFAFYNVENLFDTIDDPTINDNRYLPDSKIPWNTERYQHKLDNLAQVMSSIDTSGFPTIFGLCEVENLQVLIDLISHPDLEGAGYSILHKNSPDERGIDVAMLYQNDHYTPIVTNYIKPVFPWNPEDKTRDILYSKGVAGTKDTLHIFVNHWVSRWGGREETEPSRRFIGKLLKNITDSIFSLQPNANIIIAGDLNDNPTDVSIAGDLTALPVIKPYQKKSLYNLSYHLFEQGEGSLYYKSWDMFDQVIVSSSMLKGRNGIQTLSDDQTVIKYDWMLYQPKEGPARPSRTASGRYYGGYSDHLPVFIKMKIN
jgi:hypothetical protein